MEKKTCLPSTAMAAMSVGIPLKVYFSDIFTPPPNVHWIPCLPDLQNGETGILVKKWMKMDKKSIPIRGSKGDLVIAHNSHVENIPYALLFKYWTYVTAWDDTFRAMVDTLAHLKVVSKEPGDKEAKKTILAVPIFGTNFGISFLDAAIGILFAIRRTGILFQSIINEIHVMVPYSTEQFTTSCRSIVHLINMSETIPRAIQTITSTPLEVIVTRGRMNGITVPKCVLCQKVACNIILPCGHMFACDSCEKRLTFYERKRKCLICKEDYSHVYGLPNSIQFVARNYQCCPKARSESDSGMTYIPCGHTNVRGNICEETAPLICEICGVGITGKIFAYRF
jgi:hypothetical protein